MNTPKLRQVPPYKDLVEEAARQSLNDDMNGGRGGYGYSHIVACYDISDKDCSNDISIAKEALRKRMFD